MVEGLISVLILSFLTLVAGLIVKAGWFMIAPPAFNVVIVVYLLIRVRVKIAKAEKEKLRSRIDELQQKINSLGKKPD